MLQKVGDEGLELSRSFSEKTALLDLSGARLERLSEMFAELTSEEQAAFIRDQWLRTRL